MSAKTFLWILFIALLFPGGENARAAVFSETFSHHQFSQLRKIQFGSTLAEISNFISTIDTRRSRDFFREVVKDHQGKIYTIAGFCAVIALIFARSIRVSGRRHRHLLDKIDHLESKVLANQMNPHFIFNSLNSIQCLIANDNPREAMKYVSKFSKLLRSVIENSTKNLITLQKELANLELYIELESLRLNCDLNYSVEVKQDLVPENELIPPLIIQPIVENALWHGLNGKKGNKELQVTIDKDGNFLRVSVTDNGIGRKAAKRNRSLSTGIGLSNTLRRISLVNGNTTKNFLWIEDLVDAGGSALGTRVTLLLKRA